MKKPYIDQNLTFTDNNLLDENGHAVMMDWEDSIMQVQAETICRNGGDILNVGFGMGIIDNYIQYHNPRTHWIIENHPDVQAKMVKDGWLKKPHVRCIFSTWQKVVNYLPKFDGVYWDTWEESPEQFLQAVPSILKPNGIFTFFNNPRNELNNDESVRLMHPDNYAHLSPFFDIKYNYFDIPEEIAPLGKQRTDNQYYWHPTETRYYNPICTLKQELK
tara:strand:- start:15 stop:668 length:654 start_codon:yes stop_codon:yes gene_type:complete